MYEQIIEKIVSKDKNLQKCFKGVIARNELPKKINNYPYCFIFNTKPRSHQGEHWLALYFSKNKTAHFFDSYGLPPSFYNLEKYILSVAKTYTYNKKCIQGQSNLCGIYCIMFLYFKARKQLRNFYSKFTKNFKQNDNLILNNLLKNN